MWVLGGICLAFSAVAAFLWNYVLNLKSEIGEDQQTMWKAITKHSDKQADNAVEIERRFATKADVNDLRQHMDNGHRDINDRLDKITTLIVNRNGKH